MSFLTARLCSRRFSLLRRFFLGFRVCGIDSLPRPCHPIPSLPVNGHYNRAVQSGKSDGLRFRTDKSEPRPTGAVVGPLPYGRGSALLLFAAIAAFASVGRGGRTASSSSGGAVASRRNQSCPDQSSPSSAAESADSSRSMNRPSGVCSMFVPLSPWLPSRHDGVVPFQP